MPNRPTSAKPSTKDERPRLLPCGRPAQPQEHRAPDPRRLAEWQKRLKDYLTEKSLKHSDQRWQIAQTILESGEHLDAQGLVERVKEAYPAIGAATVYRTIKLLTDADILKESLQRPDGRVVFELSDDEHHDHIVCTDCGEIFEFHNEKIEAAQNQILGEMKFSQVKHRHVIYVSCRFKQG